MIGSEYSMGSNNASVTAADDPNATITNRVIAHLRRMRYFRKQYDQRRAYFFRQYLAQRDQRYFPDNMTPRANIFVPYPFSNVETIVSRVLDAFFSYEDWFDCRGRTALDEPAAEKMKYVLSERLRKAKLIPAFETLVRNIVIYGHAGIKVDWDWDFDTIQYMEPIYAMDQNTGQPIIDPMSGQAVIIGQRPATKQVPRMRPRFIPIDVYDLLVDPDGGIVAHLTERPLSDLKRMQQASMEAAAMDPTKTPLYMPQAFEELVRRITASVPDNPDDIVVRLAEHWDEYAQTQTIMTFGEDAEAISWKDLRASYRAAGYSPFKRRVWGGTPLLLYHGPIQFAHKKSPILHTSFIKIPNEVFGIGTIEVVSDLVEQLNKFAGMITDNWNLGVNRRYAYDMNTDIDHDALTNFNTPGGKVAVAGDPNKAILPLPIMTPSKQDYEIMALFKDMIESTSGVSDFYGKGVGSPTNNRTATGINQVINESNFRFRMFIRNLELDILQPLLDMCASMIQQYMTDPVEVQITGEQPQIRKNILVTPEELMGTLDFDLIAANYATNRFIKQRNILALANLAVQSPFLNIREFMVEVFKLFEVRNVNKLIYTQEEVAQMQQAQQAEQIRMMMLEKMLDTEGKARLSQAKPQMTKGKDGRPRKMQFEGKIPGAGLGGDIRELAQSMGVNGLGLEGAGITPGQSGD